MGTQKLWVWDTVGIIIIIIIIMKWLAYHSFNYVQFLFYMNFASTLGLGYIPLRHFFERGSLLLLVVDGCTEASFESSSELSTVQSSDSQLIF